MRALAIIALVFALGGVASSVYAFVETKPNYDSTAKDAEKPTADRLTIALQDDYRKALGRETVGAWAGGLLSLVLGGLAARNRNGRALGVVAIVIGLVGAGLGFVVMPQPLVL